MDAVVTVMITYYNQKKYISDSLGSVLQQKTSFPVEIICSDDGSTDGTYEELKTWELQYPGRIRVIQMPRIQGKKYEPIERVSQSRHKMLQMATGKYVSFLDGDDYYSDETKLQNQVDLLELYPKCSGCGQPITMRWDNDPSRDTVIGRISNHTLIIPKRLCWCFFWFHADTFLYRNYQLEEPMNINASFFDDNLITCYFIKHGPVIYSPESESVYRQIEESSWNQRNSLQKAIVNLAVYYESIKVLGWKFPCYTRCYGAFKEFYRNRNSRIDLAKGQSYLTGMISDETFITATLKYSTSNVCQKLLYEMKYAISMHSGKVIALLRKLSFVFYRRIDK